ncbi:MAG: NAD(+) synthase [Oscillospiraceae bacterium]|nr:NAD(+) synthase [Oscillospiraceae bacterium]
MYHFDVNRAIEDCCRWIQDWFAENGDGCNAVLGISGGKDSSVCAALLCRALGVHRVIGVLMPRGEQPDIDDSLLLCKHLGITHVTVNIGEAADAIEKAVAAVTPLSNQTVVNIPPRIRMTAVYAVSQSVNGRVANTCNFSEDWVGYSTRWGDSVGDFAPLAQFTVTEVKAIGRALGLPAQLVDKTPSDGLCGKTDEDNLGFTYAELDAYLREGIEPPEEHKNLIDRKHKQNLFKLKMMPAFPFDPNAE